MANEEKKLLTNLLSVARLFEIKVVCMDYEIINHSTNQNLTSAQFGDNDDNALPKIPHKSEKIVKTEDLNLNLSDREIAQTLTDDFVKKKSIDHKKFYRSIKKKVPELKEIDFRLKQPHDQYSDSIPRDNKKNLELCKSKWNEYKDIKNQIQTYCNAIQKIDPNCLNEQQKNSFNN